MRNRVLRNSQGHVCAASGCLTIVIHVVDPGNQIGTLNQSYKSVFWTSVEIHQIYSPAWQQEVSLPESGITKLLSCMILTQLCVFDTLRVHPVLLRSTAGRKKGQWLQNNRAIDSGSLSRGRSEDTRCFLTWEVLQLCSATALYLVHLSDS